jgi:predicted ribosome quality control (RQC) complex YloA/Tae2 family protein
MDKFKLYGELITANLYRLQNTHSSSIELENYYDNNNLISIPLDTKYSPNINAKRYFKKYSKLKKCNE